MTVPNLDLLPSDILLSDRAVVWKLETRDNKPTKVPYIAHRTQQRAAVDDPKTWSPFSVAVDAVLDGKADGVGIVLGGGLVGIDLDHCLNLETGAIDPFAQTIVSSLNSYTEVSPSGTGLHIWVRGEFAVKGRRRKGIEIYSTARYFTVTGQHLPGTPREIHDRSAQVAAFHARIFGPEPPRQTAATASHSTLTDTELVIKASTATNGATFQALMAGDLSVYNGDESAADLALCNLLCFWSQRDPDQIDRLFRQSKLFRAKWDSRRGQTTYGRQTINKAIRDCAETYQPVIEIDVEMGPAVQATPVTDPPPHSSKSALDDWPVLHADAFIGPVGDLVQALRPETEADPTALLTTALVMWGNLLGRRAFAAVGADRHRLNEYLLLVGSTASGRKGLAWSEIRSVMAEVDPTWAGSCLSTGLSSGEGLIHRVRDAAEPPAGKARDQIVDGGVAEKRLLVQESEFAKTLRVSRRENNTLSAVARQAWDDGDLKVLTRHNPLTATDAHISVIGHVTPLELRHELRTSEMANGFLNRFLIVLTRRQGYLPHGGALEAGQRTDLVQQFVRAKQIADPIEQLQRDPEAKAYWAELYPHLTRERAGLVGDVCSRAPAHVLRLSMLYALADGASAVRLTHLKAALAVWAYGEASARRIFSRRIGHRLADFVFALLRAHPEGLTRTELSEKLGRNRKAEDIHEALQVLLDFGVARYVTEPASARGGPKPQRWFVQETELSTN